MQAKGVFKRVAIVAIAVVTMSVAADAQVKGDMAVGGNLVLGTGDSYTNFGIGAKFQYNILDPLRAEASFTYFLKKDYVSMWDLSVNAHWLFSVADKIKLYPLAGFGILGGSASVPSVNMGGISYGGGSSSSTDFAFNLGGGIDYELTDKLVLNGELKYKISDGSRFLISAGVAYRF
ncbi:MAG: porin family protein [Tannerellaceae bacterium]|jgi:outer membrane protein X|nr:porin family protein [Tannerellaceae bacterium]